MKNTIITIFTLSLLVACSGGRNSTGYSIINDMKYSKAAEAFTENQLFANGQTMQVAPEGTIARGWMPHPKNADGSPVQFTKNPFEYNEYTAYRGEKLYKIHCLPCHGENGKGDGLVVQKGYPAPPSFKGRAWRKTKTNENGETVYSNDQGWIYNLITYGRGNMMSYAQQLHPEDRWAVSEYVRRKLGRKSSKMDY